MTVDLQTIFREYVRRSAGDGPLVTVARKAKISLGGFYDVMNGGKGRNVTSNHLQALADSDGQTASQLLLALYHVAVQLEGAKQVERKKESKVA